jgi:poly-gamma-glutamate capsule biosynthesis protein CapA/YwtB (metallophosphatase superfamily)
MKLLFIGDLQFGRSSDKECEFKLPQDIINIFNNTDAIFFNLESVLISKSFDINKHLLRDKYIHIYNDDEENITYLKTVINKPMFVSTINNHTFDYNVEGYQNTLKILDKNNYIFTVNKTYYIDDNFIYLNATDHWTILNSNVDNYPRNTKLWDDNCLLIDSYEKEQYTYNLIAYLNKLKKNRKIIFSIHWGQNFQNKNNTTTYLQLKAETFFKNLCNLGADVIFGHGAHHIMEKSHEIYNNKLIIYGLGDFTGDFKYVKQFNTDKSLMLIYDTDNYSIEKLLVSGNYKPYKNTYNEISNCKQPYM